MVVLCGCCCRAAEGLDPKGGEGVFTKESFFVCWASVELVGSLYVYTYNRCYTVLSPLWYRPQ